MMTPVLVTKHSLWTSLVGKISLVYLLLCLHACSLFMTLPTTHQQENHQQLYEQRLIALQKITQWQLQGKISITKDNKNYSGSLRWLHHPNVFQLIMTGPLGQGQLRIHGNPDQVVAIVDDDTLVANTLSQLFDKHLGWPLPIDSMHDWIRGIVTKHSLQQATMNTKGYITHVKQAQWDITLANYQAVNSLLPEQTVWLPSKITIVGQNMTLKVIIKQWQPLPTQFL